jgi:hypothetical protein
MSIGFPERAALIRRATARLCLALGWAPLHEFMLPDGRRADIAALRPDGGLVIIEVKSGLRDFAVDRKWPEYRLHSDALFFAVDLDFPAALIPDDLGLIVAADGVAEILRPAPPTPLAPARRRALLHRFATVAAIRLAAAEDPMGTVDLRAALRAD